MMSVAAEEVRGGGRRRWRGNRWTAVWPSTTRQPVAERRTLVTTGTDGTQVCSTPNCGLTAAFTTRSAPAYCLSCIDAAYRTGGLEPLEPFTSRKERRRT